MQLLHFLFGIGYASIIYSISNKLLNLLSRGRELLHFLRYALYLLVIRMEHRIYGRERKLTLTHIIAGGLTYL